jgi:hypothetical protein
MASSMTYPALVVVKINIGGHQVYTVTSPLSLPFKKEGIFQWEGDRGCIILVAVFFIIWWQNFLSGRIKIFCSGKVALCLFLGVEYFPHFLQQNFVMVQKLYTAKLRPPGSLIPPHHISVRVYSK